MRPLAWTSCNRFDVELAVEGKLAGTSEDKQGIDVGCDAPSEVRRMSGTIPAHLTEMMPRWTRGGNLLESLKEVFDNHFSLLDPMVIKASKVSCEEIGDEETVLHLVADLLANVALPLEPSFWGVSFSSK